MGTPPTLVLFETVPHPLPVQPFPLSVQFTPRFEVSFVRVAVNCAPVLICTVVVAGVTVTAIAPVEPPLLNRVLFELLKQPATSTHRPSAARNAARTLRVHAGRAELLPCVAG